MPLQASDILTIARAVCSDPSLRYPLHQIDLSQHDTGTVEACIRSGQVSTSGPYTRQFEEALMAYTGSAYCVAVNSGTAALHLALLAAGVKPGDEVLLPTFTYVATANAVRFCGATPHWLDSLPHHPNLDPDRLAAHLRSVAKHTSAGTINKETGRRLAALVPVHVWGHPCQMAELLALAAEWNLPVVEDAAEALGSTWQGRHAGTLGALGILSFNGNKVLTTGGGGAVLTANPTLAQRVLTLATTARRPHAYQAFHTEVAYNYQMPSLNAALGLAQIPLLSDTLNRKRQLASQYQTSTRAHPELTWINELPETMSNYWLNTLVLPAGAAATADQALQLLHTQGIMARGAWQPLHTLPMFEGCPQADLSQATSLSPRCICLPSSPCLA